MKNNSAKIVGLQNPYDLNLIGGYENMMNTKE